MAGWSKLLRVFRPNSAPREESAGSEAGGLRPGFSVPASRPPSAADHFAPPEECARPSAEEGDALFLEDLDEAGGTPPAETPFPAPAGTGTPSPAGTTAPPPPPPSSSELFKSALDDFDKVFDQLFLETDEANPAEPPSWRGPASPGGEGTSVGRDLREVHELFADIAGSYARPVKSFIHELQRGPVTRDWIDICLPALDSIRAAAESMDFEAAARCMNDFNRALLLVRHSDCRLIADSMRELILTIFGEMQRVLPATFAIEDEELLREAIIVNGILKQVPEVGKVTLDKLYRAGVTSLDAMFKAKSEDIAVTAGIPLWICEKIVGRFQAFREEIEGKEEQPDQSQRQRLKELLTELKKQHLGFEKATAGFWEEPEATQRKRQYRVERQETAMRIHVLLAEMNELEMVETIRRLSFEDKIAALEEFLDRCRRPAGKDCCNPAPCAV